MMWLTREGGPKMGRLTSSFARYFSGLLLCFVLQKAYTANVEVDLSGAGCDRPGGYYLQSMDDVISLVHEPMFERQATRDHCDVSVRADPERRIEYIIESIRFNECGVEILIFDNPSSFTTNPVQTITCHDNNNVPIMGKTRREYIHVRVRKTTTQSRNFQFKMRMKNDLGPPITYLQDEERYTGESIQPGVIVGIAIAGAIIIIALILIAIYLCVRARMANSKGDEASSTRGESSVYQTGNSQVLFASGAPRYPKGRYGSMEDIRSTSSSQDQANGSYTNPAYTTGPGEKRSERSSSIGRSRGKAGFSNDAFEDELGGGRDRYWQERDAETRESLRMSRKDAYDMGDAKKPMKSAMKKPTSVEMSKVNTQPINGILKTKTRSHSPNRSVAGSSTEGSLDANAIIHGYGHQGKDVPNIKHKPVIERRRSRSGSRSHRSGSSTGHRSRRSHSADKDKKQPPKDGGRMYGDVFFDERRNRPRSSSGRRARSNSLRSKKSDRTDRTSDSIDSESSTTSYSRKVSMNPGGKRVHIKGEETDI